MKRLFLLMLLTAGCLLTSKVSMAQDNMPDTTITFDTTSVPNDALTVAIRELMTETGAMNLGVTMGKRMMEMQKNNPSINLPDEFYERMMADLERGESNRWILNNAIKAYRKRFTVDEVRAITAFYRTPAGKKLASVTPEIMEETMTDGGKVGQYVALKIYFQLQREGKVH